jgi:tetratricopeptide (TPR) repeat protein
MPKDPARGLLCILFLLCSSAPTVGQQTAERAKEAYARAVELEARGDHAAALPFLWEAAQRAPDDADVQNHLGEALERMGAFGEAVEAYRRAIATRPAFRKATNHLILALVKAGRGREALARARAEVDAAPDDPDRHYTLGLALAEQDMPEASERFERVLELSPRHALARYNLALRHLRSDRLSEATVELNRVIAIEPRPEAHYTLGVIYWRQGQLDRAVGALRAAVASEPKYAEAHYTLGAVLKARGDLVEAASSLRRAIAVRPDLTAAHNVLADVLRQSGDESGAREHLAQAERLRERARREHEASVLTFVGVQKLDRGDVALALDHFRQAARVYEEYAPAHFQLGRALQLIGRRDESRAAFARAQQLNPVLVPPP